LLCLPGLSLRLLCPEVGEELGVLRAQRPHQHSSLCSSVWLTVHLVGHT
jgi:hypothetical protein